MKKVLLSLLVMGAGVLSAQVISFEQSEGFFPGTIHDQQGFTVTGDGAGGFIPGQEIVDTMSSDGTQSFMTSELPEYGPQESYIIGTYKSFAEPIPFVDGFTFSYDFYGTALDGSDFAFDLINLAASKYVTRIFFSYDGTVFFTGNSAMGEGQVHPTTGTWEANTWNTLRLELTDGMMHLFVNGTEISSGLPFEAPSAIDNIRILHDNYGGDAYYDNIRFNDTASTNDLVTAKSISTVYPNPAKDVVKIKLAEDFNSAKTSVKVTNVSGQNVASFTSVNDINVSKLPAGVYILTITDGTKTETKKLIKK